jgi:hypothetical protein
MESQARKPQPYFLTLLKISELIMLRHASSYYKSQNNLNIFSCLENIKFWSSDTVEIGRKHGNPITPSPF